MGQFANQIKQVALTYLTRRWLVFAVVTPFIGTALLMRALTESSSMPIPAAARLIGMPLFVSIPLLVVQAKIQFAHPRAVLFPNFALAHVFPVALLAILVFAIYPSVVASMIGIAPLGAMAYVSALSVTAIWAVQLHRGSLLLVSFALVMSVAFEWMTNWWFQRDNFHQVSHLLIIGASWIGFIAWLWRLVQLREEFDDYQLPPVLRSDRPSRAEEVATSNFAAKQFSRNPLLTTVSDWWLAQLQPGRLQRNPTNDHRQSRRLLAYGLSGLPAWMSAVVMGVVMLLVALIMSQLTFLGGPSARRAIAPVLYAMLFVPGFAPLTQLVQHRSRLPGMLLLPMVRTDLIDGLLTTIARGVVLNWLALVLVFALIITAFPEERVAPSTAAVLVLLSIALTTVSFGLGVQFATWEGAIRRTLAFAGCFGVLMAPFLAWWQERQLIGDLPFVLLSIFLAAIGAGIIARARQKWLNLELG